MLAVMFRDLVGVLVCVLVAVIFFNVHISVI